MRKRNSEDGSALVELAVVLPLLVALLIGGADFARVFYASIELENAARAGAQFGAQNTTNSTTAMETVTLASAPNLTGVTAAASRLCQCANDSAVYSATTPANNCSYSCTGGTRLVNLVTVTASKSFTTLVAYPGIPSSLNLSRSATMRAVQ
jgi:Flp pilus assembly protein TadG